MGNRSCPVITRTRCCVSLFYGIGTQCPPSFLLTSVSPTCAQFAVFVSFLLSLNATYFKHASTSCSTTKTNQMIIVITHSQPVPSPSDVHPDCTAGSCLKTNITDRPVTREHMREEPVLQSSASLSGVCFLLCASGCSVCKILNGFVPSS